MPLPARPARPGYAVPTDWLRRRVVLDRFVALVASVLTAPIVAVLAFAIRREDGGPPLIRVPRMGRSGTPFGMWKLRSMRATAPDGLASGANLTNGADDERITSIGRRLRSYHLDELPQLWNVAAGDMSLLGPRPETPEFVNVQDDRWREVLSVPPGIAGPTQLIVSDWEREVISASPDSGGYRNAVLPTKLAIDRWYLEAASPATDLLVAVTLLRRFLPGTEAWTLRHRVFADVAAAAPAHAFLRARQAARNATRTADRPALAPTPSWRRWRARLAHELDARVARSTPADPMLVMQPVAHDLVWSAQLDGDLVLYDAANELAHHLSPEAAAVWMCCDGHATVAAIADHLAGEVGIDREQMLRDVVTVGLQLMDAGALVDGGSEVGTSPKPTEGGARRWHPEAPAEGVPALGPAAFANRTPGFVSQCFDALGYRFRVLADDPSIGSVVAAALAPLGSTAVPEHDYWIIGGGPKVEVTQFYIEGEHLHTFAEDDDLVGMALWYLNQHAVEFTPLLAVHAAAVERGGEVVVLTAGAGAGKTTMAAALVADGYDYITEEVVALDPTSGEIVPYPLPFCLEPGSQRLFEHLAPDGATDPLAVRGDVWFVHPEQVRRGSRSAGGVVTAVIVPAFRPGAAQQFDDLTPAETLLHLLSGTMNLDRIGHDGFVRLVELAWSVPGYRLEYGDLGEARQLVSRAAAGDSLPSR